MVAKWELPPQVIDAALLRRQREWSTQVFGPGPRTLGLIEHIKKELEEIEADPDDLYEWVDVLILAFDGAWRSGHQPQHIIDAIIHKLGVNERREWPDWRETTEDKAILHIKSAFNGHTRADPRVGCALSDHRVFGMPGPEPLCTCEEIEE